MSQMALAEQPANHTMTGTFTEGVREAAFWKFHDNNPDVYDRLVTLARRWRERRGDEHLGMKMLFELVRWHVAMDPDQPGEFRLNNNLTSYYARLIMRREPDLAGVFHTRTLTPITGART